jgi:CheY-like chemotaxis protein/HPt (histidine-containing phosphotransfer) domain-containing protein/anti-sigma regulatory factor (Ser/Thr protein kinase)
MTDLMRTDNLDKTQVLYFHDIRLMGKALLEIINDVLDFSKIEAGKMELIPINFNLGELFDHICSVNRFLATNKDLEFRTNYDNNLPEVIFSDEVRIRQVITNLISNAIKYTHAGYVELSFSKRTCDGKKYLTAAIEDTGIGIKQEDHDKLFTSFSQLDEEKNRRIQGTGLGLAITKLLLNMMDGFIEFSSEYGKGSIFTAFFPLVPGDPKKIECTMVVDSVLVHDGASVLVVDDNSVNLTVAQGYLNTHNIYPDTAKSGQEAIKMVQQKDYALVFMDHMMPIMDGIEATKQIRELPDDKFKKLPIVALTANAVSGVKEMMLENGMNDFISKPIEAHELNAVLAKWMPPNQIEIQHEEKSAPNAVDRVTSRTGSVQAGIQQARIWQASIQRTKLDLDGDGSTTESAQGLTGDEAILAELRVIEGVDVKIGLLYLGGKPSSYFRALRHFCEKFPDYRNVLETTCAEKKWYDYMIQVHSIKSSSAALGLLEISGWAAMLEKASKEKQEDVCVHDTPLFCEKAQTLCDTLTASSLFQNV